MSNENHNNTGNWRTKLEVLESLPGETIVDKNASWEKLHDRLRTKKGNRKIIWYCSAAACLLLVLMIPVINSNKKNREAVKKETVQKQPVIKSSPTVLIQKRGSVQIASPLPFEEYQAATAKKSLEKYQITAPAKEIKIIRLTDAVNNTPPVKQSINPALEPLDTSLNITATVIINKKLKVVHINELGDPVEETPGIARSADIHSFQLKLANQEVFVNSSLASRTSGFTILKLKTSPN